jgi:hypothetical protein
MINNSMIKKEIETNKINNPNTEPTLLRTGLLIQSHLKISDPKSGEILLKKRA